MITDGFWELNVYFEEDSDLHLYFASFDECKKVMDRYCNYKRVVITFTRFDDQSRF